MNDFYLKIIYFGIERIGELVSIESDLCFLLKFNHK